MITNFRCNRMGTASFDGKFPGMRKAQDFIVYPIPDGGVGITIQSDTRIGEIDANTGAVLLSPSYPNGAYYLHMATAKLVCTLPADELLMLKAHIMGTASGMCGNNGIVYCDNSGALDVFGQVQA